MKFLPICNFECNNLAWGGKDVLVSIKLDIWETIKKYLGYNASSPDFFCAVIQKKQ